MFIIVFYQPKGNIRALSSAGQSCGLIIRRSQVQILEGPKNRMRTFIALEPGQEFLEKLLTSLLPLKEKYPHFRWIPKESLHITLAFLGELDEGLLPLVKESTETSLGAGEINALGTRLFTLPPRRDANVLALGFEKGGDEITSLSDKIKKNLKNRGITLGGTERKTFIPHLTVARKGREPLQLLKEEHVITVQGAFRFLGVYKSELLPQGPRYTALASYPLALN